MHDRSPIPLSALLDHLLHQQFEQVHHQPRRIEKRPIAGLQFSAHFVSVLATKHPRTALYVADFRANGHLLTPIFLLCAAYLQNPFQAGSALPASTCHTYRAPCHYQNLFWLPP